MSVSIRMKKFGRKHRPYFRICAMDKHKPRDGRVLEELGTYDPMVPETDARAIINGERINYWLSVGAQPSDNVRVLIKKYGVDGTHVEAQKAAIGRLEVSRRRPEPMAPLPRPPKPTKRPKDEGESPAKGRKPEAEAPVVAEESPVVVEEATVVAQEAPAAETPVTEEQN